MIDAGDIVVADLHGETRIRALVVSSVRFHRTSGRAIIVPQRLVEPDEVPPPWHLSLAGAVFACEFVRSVPISALLEPDGRVTADELNRVRRVIRRFW